MRLRYQGLVWAILLGLTVSFAQVLVPETEEVYGGRINWIQAIAVGPTTSRVFISTESPNSMFYAEVDHSTTPPTFGSFQPVPDFDADDNFGPDIRRFAVDAVSGYVFVRPFNQLFGANHLSGTRKQYESHGVSGLTVFEGRLIYLRTNQPDSLELVMGTIDSATGNFSPDPGSPVKLASPAGGIGFEVSLQVHPINRCLYLFTPGSSPRLFRTSSPIDSLDSTTTLVEVSTGAVSTTATISTFGIAPDGRLFLGGETGTPPSHSKFVAYSDDDGASWNNLNTGIGGTSGQNFAFAGDSSQYRVYFGTGFSTSRGESGSWKILGVSGIETHPNDGCVAVDPVNPAIVYLTTDMGIGVSLDSGYTTFEINEGVTAVMVNDLEMDDTHSTGWVASKSGIRKVTAYGTSSEDWELFYPMQDGSPYFSIATDPSHPDTVYAGNVRLYRSFDGGTSWDRVFTTEDPTFNFDWRSRIAAVTVNPDNPRFVILGVNSESAGVTGGIFVSSDYGTSWQRIPTGVYNPEVLDILAVPVDGDSTVYYIGCEYVNDGTTSSYGVKTVTYSPSTGTFAFQNDMWGESGSLITNFGCHGLAVDSLGTVFACGVNSNHEPRVYLKEKDSTYWQMLPVNGLPPQGWATALTIGESPAGSKALFVAVEHQIYYLEKGSSEWTLAVDYPVGTQINVLYWDELMVGTSTGLISYQWESPTRTDRPNAPGVPSGFRLYQNFPNPFNPATVFRFDLPEKAQVTLEIFDVHGKRVATVIQSTLNAGTHHIRWQSPLPSGVYFYRLVATVSNPRRTYQQVKKFIQLK
ncbi:MAG: T9SS type A sorting domain-containing protein [Calditrichaeota bacterium]|nr:T9SS type A sorting domain-containing protein [Calditrichota bacterium]